MNEEVVIKSYQAKWADKLFKIVLGIEISLAGLFIILAIYKCFEATQFFKVAFNSELEYECNCGKTYNFYIALRWHSIMAHESHYPSYFYFAPVYFAFHIQWVFLMGVTLLSRWLYTKNNVIVTNQMVYGKSFWGRTVSLPIQQITAVVSARFYSRLVIATTIGTVHFIMIGNHAEIARALTNLINQVQEETLVKKPLQVLQEESSLSEEEKLLGLLNQDIITQEEFDAKKAQILKRKRSKAVISR